MGWNIAWELSANTDTWVITRANNRQVIDAYLKRHPRPKLRFIYYDLPFWVRKLKRGELGIQAYYYAWQIGAYLKARKVNRKVRFSTVQHVTFVKYWTPSLMSLLPARFIWGPVGGGDSIPSQFRAQLGVHGKLFEIIRTMGQWIGEHDPLVRLTARRSQLALTATEKTLERVKHLGAKRVEIFCQVGMTEREIIRLGSMPTSESPPFRFISIGRLHYCKGFELGLRAFAQLRLRDWEYWLAGDGPERGRLETLVERLGISAQVRFLGALPREEALEALGECHVLILPGLRDAGAWVCAEAMAAGRPVVCLELGGSPVIVGKEAGLSVEARDPNSAVKGLAEAMGRLASDEGLRKQMGRAGRKRIKSSFDWNRMGEALVKKMTA